MGKRAKWRTRFNYRPHHIEIEWDWQAAEIRFVFFCDNKKAAIIMRPWMLRFLAESMWKAVRLIDGELEQAKDALVSGDSRETE